MRVRGRDPAGGLDHHDQAVASHPFATLRSMYVTENNSDVARVAWREKDSSLWVDERVVSFKRARAAELKGESVPGDWMMPAIVAASPSVTLLTSLPK